MIQTLILTEKEGWHFQQLKDSLNKLNHKVISACLSQMRITLENNKAVIFINSKKMPRIDNVIVRFIPGGTLEEIVYYLNILKIMESMNIRVINSAISIEGTVDKLYTSYLLNKNHVRTPTTFVVRGFDNAYHFLKHNIKDNTLLYKPLFGSQGDNIKLINHCDDLKEFENISNIYYFQQYLKNTVNYDYRVLILNNMSTVKCFYMTRYGETFVNNFSKGAKCIKQDINPEVINLAIRASKLMDINFCGVDIMEFEGQFYVIEVNSIPAWRGLQAVEEDKISDYLVKLLL